MKIKKHINIKNKKVLMGIARATQTHTKTGRQKCGLCRDGRVNIASYQPVIILNTQVDVPICSRCDKLKNHSGILHDSIYRWAVAHVMKGGKP